MVIGPTIPPPPPERNQCQKSRFANVGSQIKQIWVIFARLQVVGRVNDPQLKVSEFVFTIAL